MNERYPDTAAFAGVTHLGGAVSTDRDSNLVAGYEVRDPELTFNLPYFIPELKSADNITEMCGPLEYTVTISSNKPGTYEEAFKITNHDGMELKPVTVSVNTIVQEFALYEGRVNKDWRTKYDFKIEACWQEHPDQKCLTMADQPFYVRDYCAAMRIDGPPQVTMDETPFNMTVVEPPVFDPVQGNFSEPLSYNISKYLMTEDSHFVLENFNYTKYRPDASWPEIVNQGCGKLELDLETRSYAESWQDKDLMTRNSEDDMFYLPEGTDHFVTAKHRVQIGDHTVVMRVRSDLVPESSSQMLNFNIEILDCKVYSFASLGENLPFVTIKSGFSD